ncbi:MAG TPA: hypothetical protein VMW18_01545 [Candidatus Binatia bacterium]|nr:hypothetical protein [Candidatus Binatia bacterium]
MPASLTASANPVGVWGEGAAGSATITWSTGNNARGRVYLTVADGTTITPSEVLFDGDPATGARNGGKVLSVKLGTVYFLVLRQAGNNAPLATLTVTVEDLQERLIEQAAAWAALEHRLNPPQSIYDLRVHAGIDTCRVRFRTVQPTIPTVEATDMDGNVVATSFPLFGGMQTSHDVLLGDVTALPQATEIALKITATGHNILGQTREVVARSAFKTGTRHATIDFTEINVRKDGDPGIKGAGEFTFTFGAGDADDGAAMGEPWPYFRQDISDDDPPVPIRKQINISFAPRSLWVDVAGTDDDSSLFVPGVGLGERPTFTGAGSGWTSVPSADQAWVTGIFGIADLGDGTVIPLELATGNFGVAFTVKGRITVNTTAGRSPLHLTFSDIVAAGRALHVLAEAGAMTGMSGGMPGSLLGGADRAAGRIAQVLGRGPDGAVYRQLVNAERPARRDGDWSRVTQPVEGPVTAIPTGPGQAALFALDAEGVALRADIGGGRRGGEWHALGGRFTGTVVALARAHDIELLAQDAGGAVYHRSMPQDGPRPGEWQRIGERVQSEPILCAIGTEEFVVFALGLRGEVLMRQNRGGVWQGAGWQTLEGAAGARLGAATVEGQGLALALIDKEQRLHILATRDPRDLNPKAWVVKGDLQAWLVQGIEARPDAKLAPSRRETIAA